jgi:hypothetical protein
MPSEITDYLIFEQPGGNKISLSLTSLQAEFIKSSSGLIDSDALRSATEAVFYYFKLELERETVTFGEFALALEKSLMALGLTLSVNSHVDSLPRKERILLNVLKSFKIFCSVSMKADLDAMIRDIKLDIQSRMSEETPTTWFLLREICIAILGLIREGFMSKLRFRMRVP